MEIQEVLAEIKTYQSVLDGKFDDLTKQVGNVKRRCDETEALLMRPGSGSDREMKTDVDLSFKTFSDVMGREQESLKRFGRIAFETPSWLTKSTILSTGLFAAQPATSVQTAGRPMRRLRELFTVIPAPEGAVFNLRENTQTGSPAMQTEGEGKAEMSWTFSGETVAIPTLAGFVTASRQALDDVNGLGAFLDATLRAELEKKAELQLLFGDGIAPNLSGLATTATAFNTSILSGENYYKVDCLGAAAAQLQTAGYNPNFAVVHPLDWFRSLIRKTETEKQYVLASPLTQIGQRIFELEIVISDQMTEGNFLVGDASKAVIRQRMAAVIDVSFEHASNFTSNLCTLRIEERFAPQKYRPDAFVTGEFTEAMA